MNPGVSKKNGKFYSLEKTEGDNLETFKNVRQY